ncbi:hypothetical protein M9H77_29882 [Catharanthus roseus]|uniref:Uncharacterized protein n=1 Tax=Catharanthus roseus TaxID=4058 RepID=A0ACB9ZWQ7_CATRO|nr:hypothetical protein M9H77_29882 [Catharanthus roseus]
MVDGTQGKRVYGFGHCGRSLLQIDSSNNHSSTHTPSSVNSEAIFQYEMQKIQYAQYHELCTRLGVSTSDAYEKESGDDIGNSEDDDTETNEDDDGETSEDDDE